MPPLMLSTGDLADAWGEKRLASLGETGRLCAERPAVCEALARLWEARVAARRAGKPIPDPGPMWLCGAIAGMRGVPKEIVERAGAEEEAAT